MKTTNEKTESGVFILYLNGRLDATTAGDLQKEINQIIASNEKKLLINFYKLEYISSAGLRVLITTLKLLKLQEGKLLISNMNSTIFNILKVSGFTQILTIKDTQDQALAEFNASS